MDCEKGRIHLHSLCFGEVIDLRRWVRIDRKQIDDSDRSAVAAMLTKKNKEVRDGHREPKSEANHQRHPLSTVSLMLFANHF